MDKEDDILKDLWLGNIYPLEKLHITEKEEINKITSKIDCLHAYIAEKIGEDMFSKFNEYEIAYGRYADIISEEAFKQGFSIGLKIAFSAREHE